MNQREYFKNFNMGTELEIAGEFIYNGIQEINRMKVIFNDGPTFVALYDIAVGVERLQKIVFVLLGFDDTEEYKEFEKRLITHSHTGLRDEIAKCIKGTEYESVIQINQKENEFLSMLQAFYKTARYERFLVGGRNAYEIGLFNDYLVKYTKVEKDLMFNKGLIINEEIKQLIGRTLGGISKKYYKLIYSWCMKNNLYTYEINSFSKASKIFRGEYRKNSLIEEQMKEQISLKELLIYLRRCNDKNAFIRFIDDIEPLEFDPALVVEYLEEIVNGIIPEELVDYVEEMYLENQYSIERINLVNLLGKTGVMYDYPMIEQCGNILDDIVSNKILSEDKIKNLMDNKEYINEEEIEELLNNVNEEYLKYKQGSTLDSECLKKIEELASEYKSKYILKF